MLKVRVTFVDDLEGRKEKDDFIDDIKKQYSIVNESKVYKGRGSSKYSNIYLDLYKK